MADMVDFNTIAGEPPPAATFVYWRDVAHMEGVIVGTHTPSAASLALDLAADAGLACETYTYPTYPNDPRPRFVGALTARGNRDAGRPWIDIEPYTDQLIADRDHYREWTEQTLEIAASMLGPVGVYTGRWVWQRAGWPSQWLLKYPRWESWPGSPNFDCFDDGSALYGGLEAGQVLIRQYSESTRLGGWDVDLNVTREDYLMGMTPEEKLEQDTQRLASLLAGDALRRDWPMMEMRLAFVKQLAGK